MSLYQAIRENRARSPQHRVVLDLLALETIGVEVNLPVVGMITFPWLTPLERVVNYAQTVAAFTDATKQPRLKSLTGLGQDRRPQLLASYVEREGPLWLERFAELGVDSPTLAVFGVPGRAKSRRLLLDGANTVVALGKLTASTVVEDSDSVARAWGFRYIQAWAALDSYLRDANTNLPNYWKAFAETAVGGEIIDIVSAIGEAAAEDTPRIIGEVLGEAANKVGETAGRALGGFAGQLGLAGAVTAAAILAVKVL